MFYDSKVVIEDKHLFVIGQKDDVARKAKKLKGKMYGKINDN